MRRTTVTVWPCVLDALPSAGTARKSLWYRGEPESSDGGRSTALVRPRSTQATARTTSAAPTCSCVRLVAASASSGPRAPPTEWCSAGYPAIDGVWSSFRKLDADVLSPCRCGARGRIAAFSGPLQPVLSEQLARMQGADGAISASKILGLTVLVTAPARAFRMRRVTIAYDFNRSSLPAMWGGSDSSTFPERRTSVPLRVVRASKTPSHQVGWTDDQLQQECV